jgi:hypothetical protein
MLRTRSASLTSPDGNRRSPVEIIATMGSYLTRTQAAEVSGLRAGPFGRWADGVTAMREDCVSYARYWQSHNDRVAEQDGPLWVVLGDSTAQGLGAPTPRGGYVGQVLAGLRQGTVLLDLPLPTGCWGFLGRASVPYVTRINRTLHQCAAARGLPVAEISAHFQPPWTGKFASDYFHPSQAGYRDWARALQAALPL